MPKKAYSTVIDMEGFQKFAASIFLWSAQIAFEVTENVKALIFEKDYGDLELAFVSITRKVKQGWKTVGH